MKRFKLFVLTFLLIVSTLAPMTVHAEGEGNIDNGGGGLGEGTDTNFWNTGDEQVIRSIAGYVGMDYDTLISGDYKLLLEPIAYVTYQGTRVAFTATEAALYNQVTGGMVRKKLTSLTHKNLPLAMFLETSDLGYPAWSGGKNQKVSDDEIIGSLGLGIVRFNEVVTPQVIAADYEYRVNTDVVTAVTISGGQSDPDNPVSGVLPLRSHTRLRKSQRERWPMQTSRRLKKRLSADICAVWMRSRKARNRTLHPEAVACCRHR